VIETGSERFPYLVCAPTMRVPMDIRKTVNAYLAMRGALIAIRDYNAQNDNAIKSVVFPGSGTSVGKMPPARCAYQMRMAYDHVIGGKPSAFATLQRAWQYDDAMRRG